MFHHLLRSDIPESEKITARLNAEAVSFLGAGTYPTAATLIFVAYCILADSKIEARLQDELKEVMANFDEEVSRIEIRMRQKVCAKQEKKRIDKTLTDSRYRTGPSLNRSRISKHASKKGFDFCACSAASHVLPQTLTSDMESSSFPKG